MTNATVFAECVKVVTSVANCRALSRAVCDWFQPLIAPAHIPLGGYAKRAAYIAVASSLSPPK